MTENKSDEKIETEEVRTTSKPEKVRVVEDQGGDPVGALILISIGVIFLLNNLNILPWGVWGVLWRFWPLILVLVGMKLVFGRSVIAKWLIAFLGFVIIGSIILLAVAENRTDVRDYLRENYSWFPTGMGMMGNYNSDLSQKTLSVTNEDYVLSEELNFREIKTDIGVTQFTITDNNEKSYYEVDADYFDDFGEPRVESELNGDTLNIDFSTKDNNSFNFMRFWDLSKVNYDMTVGFEDLATKFDLNLGTGKGTIDLDQVNINSLKASVGTGSLDMTLSKKSLRTKPQMTVEVGTGKVTISIPEDVGLNFDYNLGTGSVKIDGDNYHDDGTYVKDFDSASSRVDLSVEVGTGSVEIVRK